MEVAATTGVGTSHLEVGQIAAELLVQAHRMPHQLQSTALEGVAPAQMYAQAAFR